jgi:hypothetical protein
MFSISITFNLSKLCKDLGFDVYWYIKYQER